MTAPAPTPDPAAPADEAGGANEANRADERADALVEGSGIVSSYYDLGEALDEQDGAGVAWAAAAAGLETLGFVADPFGSLTSAVAGWAIEHLWFLREPLDALAGDPAGIAATARSWQALSLVLTAGAGDLRAAGTDANGAWHGTAADGFAATAGEAAAATERVAGQAMLIAELVLRTGATVGAERAIIRNAVADFLASLVSAGVLSLITGGAATPLTVTNALLDAVALGHRLGDRVATLIETLRRAAEIAGDAERALRATLPQLERRIEHGKQEAAARAATVRGGAEPAA